MSLPAHTGHELTALGRQELLRRSSGILLHPTSLPGPHGIGDLGPAARRFVDFLAETGQTLWQILPLGPVGYGNSPYMCLSAFAGNPLLLSLDRLADDGLLEQGEIDPPAGLGAERVDYAQAAAFKRARLKLAYGRFESHASAEVRQAYFEFCERTAAWLEDYVLFAALKEAHDGRKWTAWEAGAAQRASRSRRTRCERASGRCGLGPRAPARHRGRR